MELKEIVAISGMSGLYQSISQRDNGMIVSPVDSDKKQFVSARLHTFTPMDGVAVYTKDDSKDLREVLLKMLEEEKNTPPVDPKSDPEVLKGYFKGIVPDFDEGKVYTSDIKKIIKWFHILKAHDLIKPVEEEEKKEEEKSKGEETGVEKIAKKNKEKQDIPQDNKAQRKHRDRLIKK